jgi:hypothetical protein
MKGVAMSNRVDYLFKVIAIGSVGLFGKRAIQKLATDRFDAESPYLDTIGTDICISDREIDDEQIRLAFWLISDSDNYQNLRRAYYTNASMIVLLVESTNPESVQHYRRIVDEIYAVRGTTPMTIVADKTSDIDYSTVTELACEFGASQVILDFIDNDELEKAIDRMVREFMFLRGSYGPYPLTLLRNHGLALNAVDMDSIIDIIRNSDSPFDDPSLFDIEKIDDYLQESISTIFLDINRISKTQLAVHIPKILKERVDELQRTWVVRKDKIYDLRYIWLTAYGFEILKASGFGMTIKKKQLTSLKKKFADIGIKLLVKDEPNIPAITMSEDLRQFVWNLVERMHK